MARGGPLPARHPHPGPPGPRLAAPPAQMAGTLHFGLPPERLHPAFGGLVKEINGAGGKRKYRLQTANRLWGQKDYGFLPDFLKLTEANYGAGLKEVDFIKASEQARK